MELPKSSERSNLDCRQIEQLKCACKEPSECVDWDCECFSRGAFCDEFCICFDCRNLDQNEAIDGIRDSNRHDLYGVEYTKGCFCKENGCLKNYYECLKANIVCSDKCECMDCKNFEGSEERKKTLVCQHSAPKENCSTSDVSLSVQKS